MPVYDAQFCPAHPRGRRNRASIALARAPCAVPACNRDRWRPTPGAHCSAIARTSCRNRRTRPSARATARKRTSDARTRAVSRPALIPATRPSRTVLPVVPAQPAVSPQNSVSRVGRHFKCTQLRLAPRIHQPTPDALLLDDARERFVELAVARESTAARARVHERSCRRGASRASQHRAEHGIRQVPQRGVRADPAHGDVIATHRKFQPERASARFVEVAAVGDATCDREAPAPWLDRELWRSHHVPHDIWPAEIGVAPVALACGQCEFTFGESCARLPRARVPCESPAEWRDPPARR